MIEAIVLSVITNVISDYITGLLTTNQRARKRSELIALIDARIATGRPPENRTEARHLAARELDAVVQADRSLSWRRDGRLVVRPSTFKRSLPSPRTALDELAECVTERRRELGLPLTAEAHAVDGPPDTVVAGRNDESVEGVLIPPGEPFLATPPLDLRAEVLSLPTEVLREKDRRRRESGRG